MSEEQLGAAPLSRGRQWQILALAAGVVLGVVGVASVLGVSHPQAAVDQSERGVFRPTEDQLKSLTLATVQSRAFNLVEVADGKIAVDDDHTTQVFSPYTGRVTAVQAELGQSVRKGAPLFTVAAAEASQGRSDLSTALGAVATAQAQLKLAREAEARQGELYRTAGGALKDWRQAQSDLVVAQGNERSAEAALGLARGHLAALGKTPAEVAALEQAPLDQAVRTDTTVAAPISGVVIKRALGPGQNITPGGDALFAISDLSSVWLVAQAPETEAGKFHTGGQVSVTTPAYPGRVFQARVDYVAPALDPDTHRLPVRAVIANPDGALKPDMFAEVQIVAGSAGTGVAAPEGAVVREGDVARVWTLDPDGALRVRAVTTGVSEGGLVQITAGLKPGERVVTQGALFVDHAGLPD